MCPQNTIVSAHAKLRTLYLEAFGILDWETMSGIIDRMVRDSQEVPAGGREAEALFLRRFIALITYAIAKHKHKTNNPIHAGAEKAANSEHSSQSTRTAGLGRSFLRDEAQQQPPSLGFSPIYQAETASVSNDDAENPTMLDEQEAVSTYII
jgi:hypothetical protein